MCYQCQNIFHKRCLEDWDKQCKSKNNNFKCPTCTYELPLKDWKEKINYEEERNNKAKEMNELQQNKEKENLYYNLCRTYSIKYNDLKKEFEIYTKNVFNVFEKIVNKII